jgi:uncharacterized protein (DUF433 family)
MTVALDPNEMDMQILALIAEPRTGGAWCSATALVQMLRFDRGEIGHALEILESEKCIIRKTRKEEKKPLNHTDTAWEITPKGLGKFRRLRARAAAQFNLRLSKDLHATVKALAEKRGTTASAIAIQFIDEGARMALYPGIDFRWTPAGRAPHVTGTGLSVWEIFQIWFDHKGDLAKIQENYPHLTAAQINPTVAYAKTYAHEIPPPAPVPASFREVKV